MTWRTVREDELGPQDHTELAALLRASFPTYAHAYPGSRSWAGARPELRVVAHDDRGPAAHLGAARRFLRLDAGGELLVATVGMVAVRPDLQGGGTGRQLMHHLRRALGDLAVPFGMLQCGEQVYGYYRSVGWHLLPPTPVSYGPLDVDDPHRSVTDTEGWMVLPVAAALEDWPAGGMHWDGEMI